MKLVITTTKETHIDLNSTPYKEWPEEAKLIAYDLMSSPRHKKAFFEQLPGLRHSWLSARVELFSQPLSLTALF